MGLVVVQQDEYCCYLPMVLKHLCLLDFDQFFVVVSSACCVQCTIMVSVVVLPVASWKNKKKIHNIN